MNALSARFSFLYDVQALTIVNALFVVWAACTVVWLLRRRTDNRLLLDLAAITVLSALPRIAFFQKTSLRPNSFFRELALPPDAFSFDYPVAFPALLRMINAVVGADLHEVSWHTSLIVGSLTPAVFYLLALRLTQHRKLAWTVALLLAFNPAHVMLTGPHDFFITGVFFEVVSHLLLLLFFQTQHFVFFGGFLLASNLFYLSRPENSAVFYLHGLCVLYALWRLPVNKITLAAGAAFFGVNLAFQYDWYEAGKYQVHVVQHIWMAPVAWVLNFADPTWNHLVDWRWCPPYMLALLVLGTIRILRTRSPIHVYPFVIFATFFAIYSDIRCCTVHANARYFTNITPAVLLVAGEAIAWLYQRWEKTFPLVVAAIVAVFCAYVPRLADNQYITQYEWEFYWTQARQLVDGNRQVWMYDPEANHWVEYANAQSSSRVATAVVRRIFGVPETSTRDFDRASVLFYETEFAQGHLFDDGQTRITHRSATLAPGDYTFLGAHCYQFVVAGDRMLPECEQQLQDPRNEILAKASYPARFYNTAAPWVRSGAHRNFRTTTFYLLRRHA